MNTSSLRILTLAFVLGGLSAAPAVNVTFRVNMGVQIAMGQFNPNDDLVTVGATFNSWSPSAFQLTRNLAEPDIWEGTVDLPAGSWPNYKFIMQRFGIGSVWELNGVGPNGSQNRWFQVPATDTVLATVHFNNVTNVILHHAPITFQVDMSVPIATGAFDPNGGTLTVSGDVLDNWANLGTHPLAATPTNAALWTGTFPVTNNTGNTVSYKFVMNGVWETIPNRTFVMPASALTLPPVYFNNVSNPPVPIPVTFSVNLGVAQARGQFNPGNNDFVEARGSFLSGPGGVWLGGFTLTNSPANPIVYSGTATTTNAVGATMLYQFVINGATWESTGDRTHQFADTNALVLPVAFLNNVTTLGPLTNTPLTATSAQLSWLGGPAVRVQTSASLAGPWQNVPGTEGQHLATVPVGPWQTYFRLVGP